MDQLLRTVGGKLTISLYDQDGVAAEPPVGQNTADVTDSAGVAIAGSPFNVDNPGGSTGVLEFTIPNTLATLDAYDVRWNVTDGSKRDSQFELVGAFLFEIAELRAYDAQLTAAKYPASLVREVRWAVDERFRRNAGVSFVTRGRRAFLDGRGTSELILPDVEAQKVVAIKVDGAALSAGDLANVAVYPHGQIVWDAGTFTPGNRNVEILYEHGMKSAPEPVFRAALRYARHILLTLPGGMAGEENERATAQFTETGGYRITIAGRDGPTGLPEVDAVLEQFGRAEARFGSFA